MSKFKVGDRVILTKFKDEPLSSWSDNLYNKSLEIIEINSENMYSVNCGTSRFMILEGWITIDPQWYREQRLKGLLDE